MKSVLRLDETPSALERSFKAATKFRRELPTDIGWTVYHLWIFHL